MKTLFKIILSTIIASILAGCATTIPNKKIIAKYNCDVIIDVRTPEEFSEKHLKGAILMPVDIIEEEIAKYDIPKDAKIGVYCKRGIRAELAKGKLKNAGYKNVQNLGSLRGLERIAKKENDEDIVPKQRSRESLF